MACWNGFEGICQPDHSLEGYTWYRLGGPARWFFSPQDEAQLAELVRRCRHEGVRWRVLGGGANVLVPDEGVADAVIKLAGPHFSRIEWNEQTLEVGGAADFTRVIKLAAANGWGGLERLAGIPGTLGGAIRMNAGGKYGAISDFAIDVTLITPSGSVATWPASDVGFGYRTTRLHGCVVVGARLRFEPGDPASTTDRFKAIWNEKYSTQPPVSERSAGCIFKNPPNASAGALIDRAGLKGHRIGDAEISRRHANFIVAGKDAKAAHVRALIEVARERVHRQFGTELQLEVDVW